MNTYTVTYSRTRDGRCYPRQSTEIDAATMHEAAKTFVHRLERRGQGFIHAQISGPDGDAQPITPARSWAENARLG